MRHVITASLTFFIYAHVFAQGGDAGLSFLKLGVGGRAIGMGDANVALATDATALHYNPAGLTQENKTDITVMHNEWIKDVRTEFLGVKIPLSCCAVGAFANTTNVSGIEIRQVPGPPEGTFSAHDFAAGAAFAYQIDPSFSIGITAKFLYEKLLVDESVGGAFDLGFLYLSPVEGLQFGLTASNFGFMSKLREERTKLPSAVRIGCAYMVSVPSLSGTVSLAADGFKVLADDKVHLAVGGEFDYGRTFAARIGYQFGYESKGISAGVGMRYGMFKVDYGFTPFSLDLGSAHTLSVGVEF